MMDSRNRLQFRNIAGRVSLLPRVLQLLHGLVQGGKGLLAYYRILQRVAHVYLQDLPAGAARYLLEKRQIPVILPDAGGNSG